jgi:hypothetical protein
MVTEILLFESHARAAPLPAPPKHNLEEKNAI